MSKFIIVLLMLAIPLSLASGQPSITDHGYIQSGIDTPISIILREKDEQIEKLHGQVSMLTIVSLLSLLIGGTSLAIVIRKQR